MTEKTGEMNETEETNRLDKTEVTDESNKTDITDETNKTDKTNKMDKMEKRNKMDKKKRTDRISQAEEASQRRQRGAARGKLTRKCNLLFEHVSQGKSFDVITACYEEVALAFRELEKRHEDLITLLCVNNDGVKLESKIEEEEKYMTEAEKIKLLAYEQMLSKRGTGCDKTDTTERLKVQIKPIEPPKFDGDIRQYQTFRNNYDRVMTATYGENAFALYQCLTGEALNVVHGVEDDYDEMIHRLDQRYADPTRLTDFIIEQLKKLKPIPEGNNVKFLEAVEIIEKCWTDVQRNNLKEQMSTVFVLSLIERILPSQQKREWVKLYQSLTNKVNAFPELMKFLKKERELINYLDTDVRKSFNSSKASFHGIEVKEEGNEIMTTLLKLQNQQAEHQTNMECILQKLTQVMETRATKERQSEYRPKSARAICWYHNSDSHSINRCSTFHNLDPKSKMDVLKKNLICFHCLGKGHGFKSCNEKRTCFMKDNNNVCGKPHHPKLHDLFTQANLSEVNVHINKSKTSTLLMIGQVNCKDNSLVTLFDPGSTNSLITHSKASELGLTSVPYRITMTTVGNICDSIYTKLYKVPLVDETGNRFLMHCVGMDEITSDIKPINVNSICEILEISETIEISRPHGKVDLLIGADNCNVIPSVVRTVGNLQLLKGPFGYCIRGSHPELAIGSSSQYHALINHIHVYDHVSDFKGETCMSVKETLDQFFTRDHLGTNSKPKCIECKNCTECTKENNLTLKEEEEMDLILKGLRYNEQEKVWTAHYPWLKEPNQLPNNFKIAVMRLKGTERRLQRKDKKLAKEYQEQIYDMERRGVARKLGVQELKQYQGPIHYLSHHEIVKPDSSSTPIRIVFNASAAYKGHVLNNYWAKGPNVLNSLFGLLLRFRENPVAFIGDISKMFNSIRLSELDSHVHRFLWRDFEDRAPDHYALTAVPFGDVCSPAIAVLTMRQTALKYKREFTTATNIIMKDSYMDDIIHSTTGADQANQLMKDIEFILKEGNFQIKKWIVSGNYKGEREINLLETGEKVLGLVWNPVEDEIRFKIKLERPNVSAVLTKRQVLSKISTIFDPMGYAAPITLSGKLLMRETVMVTNEGRKLDWDDPMPEELKGKWLKFFTFITSLTDIKIPRCIRTSKLVEPTLILFCDASTLAYSTCAYARWKIDEDKYESRLLAAKSRLAPIKAVTIPKLELCSAVLSTRLRRTIINESNIEFEYIYHLTDSEIVLSQIAKENLYVGTYVANRVAEIRESTSNREWRWIPSKLNVADLLTRPMPCVNIDSISVWQNGPDFLKQSEDTWPTKSISIKTTDEMKIETNIAEFTHKLDKFNMFDITNFSSYKKLIRVTARILKSLRMKSFKAISTVLTADELKNAETLWFKHAQQPLLADWQTRFKRLGPFMKDDILYVGSRIAPWMKSNYNNEAFILLPHDNKVTELCIKEAHDRDHGGIETTLCKLQTRFWIPQARKLIKKIKFKCVVCRRLEKTVVGQSMGPVPEERLKPTPAFYHCALDIFGPMEIKDTVKARCRKKVYGVVINCLSTRAAYVDLIEGYDSDSFLTTLRRFIAIRGFPKTIYSDRGTQLKSASKEINSMFQDQKRLSTFGNNEGMEWKFTKSADAPWENGCSEAMVKLVKKAMMKVIGDAILTFGELQSALFEVANILNERPIGLKNGSSTVCGTYLCPNDLLLGRASVQVPEGIFAHNVCNKTRQNFINRIVKSFWKKWMINYFPTLLIHPKWHCDKRNLRVGDIVLVQDSNAVKGNWKLAEVCRILPSTDGKVRDVEIRYKIQKQNRKYEGQLDTKVNRSVHKLVLILPVEEQ